jgi:hypothetical protein
MTAIEFSDRDELSWDRMEKNMAEGLRRSGVAEEVIKWVLREAKERALPVIKSLDRTPMQAPPGTTPEAAQLAQGIIDETMGRWRNVADGLLLQLMLALGELFLAKFSTR